MIVLSFFCFYFFFFNDTATTEIYTLSLHDALPISGVGSCSARSSACGRVSRRTAGGRGPGARGEPCQRRSRHERAGEADRKSTRLNSSHSQISYAVFCLKKKKKQNKDTQL